MSAEEESQVNHFLPYDISYWIGLNDLASEGKVLTIGYSWRMTTSLQGNWRWAESHTDAVTVYTNWDGGQPDNLDGNEDCVRKAYDTTQAWFDWNCENNLADGCHPIHALCQINLS